MGRRWAFSSLALIWLALATPARTRATDVVETELGPVEIFGELAAELHHEMQGHWFSVSPDEQWIAVSVRSREPALWVLHLPTRRKWTHPPLGDLYPNCFSEDGSRLYAGAFSAPLSPDMASLAFTLDSVPKDLEGLEGRFLGFAGALRDRNGVKVTSWGALPERHRLLTAWGPGWRVLYEVVSSPGEASRIRLTPPGETRSIDFEPLIEARERLFREEMGKLLTEHPSPENREFAESVAAEYPLFVELQRGATQLSNVSVSPNGRWLAATAGFEATAIGTGVLIPLDGDPLRARPYSQHLRGVLGRQIWSTDSRRLYFMGKADEALGPTRVESVHTVYRLELHE